MYISNKKVYEQLQWEKDIFKQDCNLLFEGFDLLIDDVVRTLKRIGLIKEFKENDISFIPYKGKNENYRTAIYLNNPKILLGFTNTIER